MSRRVQKILKRKVSKRMATLIEKHGEEEARRLVKEWATIASHRATEVASDRRGFAVTGKAVEAANKSAEVRRAKLPR